MATLAPKESSSIETIPTPYRHSFRRMLLLFTITLMLGALSFFIPIRIDLDPNPSAESSCVKKIFGYGFPLIFDYRIQDPPSDTAIRFLGRPSYAQVNTNSVAETCFGSVYDSEGPRWTIFIINMGIYWLTLIFVDRLAFKSHNRKAYYWLVPFFIVYYLIATVVFSPEAYIAYGI